MVTDAQCQHENIISEGDMAAENDEPEMNLIWREPMKFRLLSDILKELAGPCDATSAKNVDSDFNTETEYESDDFTLDTYIRKKKGVRVTHTRSGSSRKKRKTLQDVEPRLDQVKRSKPVSEDSHGNDSEFGYKLRSRKTRIDEVGLLMTKKRKKSSYEIRHPYSQILHENKGSEENTLRSQKGSLSLCAQKSNRGIVHKDCAREVLKVLDESQWRFIEKEKHSRPAHGVQSAQLVQSPTGRNMQVESSEAHKLIGQMTTTSNKNTVTASGCDQKRIRERSLPSEDESIAALQLLRLYNAEVHTNTSSNTATEDPALSVAKHKSSCRLEGHVQPASAPMVCQPSAEVYMVNGAALAQAA